MPIRPEIKARYPYNWAEIRERILERDGHKCKFCGVENYAHGWRDEDGTFHEIKRFSEGDMREAVINEISADRIIRIVLTIAHLHDMRPEACDDDNLAALCQRCHNRHDIEHRKETRRSRLAVKDLFDA